MQQTEGHRVLNKKENCRGIARVNHQKTVTFSRGVRRILYVARTYRRLGGSTAGVSVVKSSVKEGVCGSHAETLHLDTEIKVGYTK